MTKLCAISLIGLGVGAGLTPIYAILYKICLRQGMANDQSSKDKVAVCISINHSLGTLFGEIVLGKAMLDLNNSDFCNSALINAAMLGFCAYIGVKYLSKIGLMGNTRIYDHISPVNERYNEQQLLLRSFTASTSVHSCPDLRSV